MTTVAWLFVIVAILMIRQIAKGRAVELPTDLRDFLLALLSGDTESMREIFLRTGAGLTAEDAVGGTDSTVSDSGSQASVTGSANGVALLKEAQKLGAPPNNRYGWGSTGPKTYDCSGLVWRAARNIGVYKGARFTTYTFRIQSKGWAKEVKTPAVGDIVLWGGHMGIVSGPNKMFNALNTKKGILESSISGHSGTPSYWRIG